MIALNSNSWPFKIDEIHDYAFMSNFLSKKECEEIIKIGNNKRVNEATVFGKNNVYKEKFSNIFYEVDKTFKKIKQINH